MLSSWRLSTGFMWRLDLSPAWHPLWLFVHPRWSVWFSVSSIFGPLFLFSFSFFVFFRLFFCFLLLFRLLVFFIIFFIVSLFLHPSVPVASCLPTSLSILSLFTTLSLPCHRLSFFYIVSADIMLCLMHAFQPRLVNHICDMKCLVHYLGIRIVLSTRCAVLKLITFNP